ncbi:N-acetylgalactosaminyltransferase 7-like [Condylostylus longicornis]|uniref:N-acetylgalactosaminyltransferase 7-like n=1 Tax=Condylostylus longicornis TaxID=2530218 RepID=UPI00244DB2D1|nr:N-acetylgalactosaminyltransferase 7-like [Condylostylus longicornis]
MTSTRQSPEFRNDITVLYEQWQEYRSDIKLVEGLGNYEPVTIVEKDGVGEKGKPAYYPTKYEEQVINAIDTYGINSVVSDLIALNRSIPDTRNDECQHWHYPQRLPNTSVIIVFHNEALSVLMRTFHTVIFRTPEHLLHEIILIDDFSDIENLKDELENKIYGDTYYNKVKIFRNKKREGLIRSKINGVLKATGEVVAFLDAHCEVNVNWLPPLLTPIVKDHRTMTVPFVDGIDFNTFEYTPVYGKDALPKGIFEWGMFYKEKGLTKYELQNRKHYSEPYYSPTHAGGLFAINRQYFIKLGIYDPGLLIWGGENFELSFKIWQCGGSIQWVPCSRVGHIYRAARYSFADITDNIVAPIDQYNYKRVIEVWFDDKYKEFFYTREPLTRFIDVGDLSSQIELKSNLNCKNFDWYMENIASDVLTQYPYPPKNLYWGEIKTASTGLCLDILNGDLPRKIGVRECHKMGGSQLFRLNTKGQLSNGERCIEIINNTPHIDFCQIGKVNGAWRYDFEDKQFYEQRTDKCLTLEVPSDNLIFEECDDRNPFQIWEFNQLNPWV